MKNVYMLCLFLTTSFSSFAQDCEAKASEVDEITEELVEYWGGKLGGKSSITLESNGAALYLIQDKENENRLFIIFSIINQIPDKNSSNFNPTFLEGEEFIIKTDGGVLKFQTEKVTKKNKHNFGTYSVYNQLKSSISKEDITKLANEKILFYRAPMESGEKVEGEVGKKDAKKLQEQFSCFLTKI